MNYLDLFAGIGGFALAAYNAGWRFDKHYFSEIDDYACEVYSRRFPDAIPLGDITKIDSQKLLADSNGKRCGNPSQRYAALAEPSGRDKSTKEWFLTGGFPCQDISVAGKGAGIRGSRSSLWFEMWRLIRDLRPRWVIAENVGALTFRGLSVVLNSLAEIRYDAEWQDIRASDVGAPHRRERIWIVSYPNGNGKSAMPFNAETSRLPQDVADSAGADGSDYSGRQKQMQLGRSSRTGTIWTTEPDVGRVAHGIPSRVDRLRCLGNSIVPACAEMIFRAIGGLYHARK